MFHRPSAKSEAEKSKWGSKLVPGLRVGITAGPGMIWTKTYASVLLSKVFGDDRASKLNVRRIAGAEVKFPLSIPK